MENLIKFFAEEPIDNLIAPCAFRPCNVVYIFDPSKTGRDQLSDIERTLKMFDRAIKPYFVSIRDIDGDKAWNALRDISRRLPNAYADYTGAADPSFFGAFGRSARESIKSFMIDTSLNKAIILSGITDDSELSFACPKFNIDQIISAHGASAVRSGRPVPSDRYFPILKALSRIILADLRVWRRQGKFMQRAQALYSDGMCVECETAIDVGGERIHLDEHFMMSLHEVGALDYVNIKNSNVKFKFHDAFIKECLCDIGIWTEMVSYITALESGYFDDVRMSVKIDWDGDREDACYGSAFNEIDVVCVKGYTPLFISCKTSEPTIEAVNELYIYAKKFGGKRAACAIVTLGDMNTEQAFYSGIPKRAHELNIEIADSDDIKNGVLIEKLKKAVESES